MSSKNVEILLPYLNSNSIGVCDTIINRLFKDFISESLQYLPQLLSLYFSNNKNNKHIETFILYCCGEYIKYSIISTWILNAFVNNSNNKQALNLTERIEKSFVNKCGLIYNGVNSSQGNDCDVALLKCSESKQNKLNYYYEVIKFYSELKTLCESLKCVSKGKCSFNNNKDKILKSKICDINYNLKNLHLNYLSETNIQTKTLFRGIIFPFNDHYIEDDKNFIIVRIDPKYSSCFTTKERVLIKLVCECIRIENCDKWNELYDKYKPNESTRNENINKDISFNYKVVHSFINTYKENEYNQNKTKNDLISNELIEYEHKHSKHLSFSLSSSIYINTPFFISKYSNTKHTNSLNSISIFHNFNPFASSTWSTLISDITSSSPYCNFPSYSIKAFLVKSNDDLRQEHFCMQLIKLFNEVFLSSEGLYLTPYEIQVTSSSSGLIEYIPNTISFDYLKRKLYEHKKQSFCSFFNYFFKSNLHNALINFAGSLAAYSLICYFLQIKDRHNGNILLNMKAHLIHIDFGFILGSSPGNNFHFESAPFKFTKDYMDVLGGVDSFYFKYFKLKFFEGFEIARKWYERFEWVIKGAMPSKRGMRCFEGKDGKKILREFRRRFLIGVGQKEFKLKVENIINEAIKNKRTRQYDLYQYIMNGIYY